MVGLGMVEVSMVGRATEASSRGARRSLTAQVPQAKWPEGEVEEEERPGVAV